MHRKGLYTFLDSCTLIARLGFWNGSVENTNQMHWNLQTAHSQKGQKHQVIVHHSRDLVITLVTLRATFFDITFGKMLKIQQLRWVDCYYSLKCRTEEPSDACDE